MPLDPSSIPILIEEIKRIIENDGPDPLDGICRLLRDNVGHYDWVGFYLVSPEKDRELVLGPYAGEPTEHTKIGFGQGICGQAADTGKLFLIQDVALETNYLSCSPKVRSEIVLPIFRDGRLVGELDIDSHDLRPFTDVDSEFLDEVCRLSAPLL